MAQSPGPSGATVPLVNKIMQTQKQTHCDSKLLAEAMFPAVAYSLAWPSVSRSLQSEDSHPLAFTAPCFQESSLSTFL